MRTVMGHIGWAAAAAIVAAAVLTGAQRLYTTDTVQRPLVAALDRIPGVAAASLHSAGNPVVALRLGPTASLSAVYPPAAALVRARLGPSATLVLQDNPDGAERRAANRMQFMIAQAEATGQFVALDNAVRTAAGRMHVRVTLTLASGQLCLTLTDGSGHRWLQAVPLTGRWQAHV